MLGSSQDPTDILCFEFQMLIMNVDFLFLAKFVKIRKNSIWKNKKLTFKNKLSLYLIPMEIKQYLFRNELRNVMLLESLVLKRIANLVMKKLNISTSERSEQVG